NGNISSGCQLRRSPSPSTAQAAGGSVRSAVGIVKSWACMGSSASSVIRAASGKAVATEEAPFFATGQWRSPTDKPLREPIGRFGGIYDEDQGFARRRHAYGAFRPPAGERRRARRPGRLGR